MIEEEKAGKNTVTGFEEQPLDQSVELCTTRDSGAGSLTDTTMTDEMLAMRIHLEEVQNTSSSRYFEC